MINCLLFLFFVINCQIIHLKKFFQKFVKNFICQNFLPKVYCNCSRFLFQLCMWTHFSENELASLCCKRENIREKVLLLNPDNVRSVLKLPSANKHLKSKKTIEQSRVIKSCSTRPISFIKNWIIFLGACNQDAGWFPHLFRKFLNCT